MGKVVVINAEVSRYEYQHPAYQLVLADGGNSGATGGRGQAVFETPALPRQSIRQMGKVRCPWEIKPENAQWAKEALAKIKAQEKEKKAKGQGGTLMEIRPLTQPEQKYTYSQSTQIAGQDGLHRASAWRF